MVYGIIVSACLDVEIYFFSQKFALVYLSIECLFLGVVGPLAHQAVQRNGISRVRAVL